MIGSAAVVAAGTTISRLTGFGAFAALAYALGFTRLTDAYNLANNTPNLLLALLLGGVLTASVLPLFVVNVERGDDEATDAILSAALVVVVAIAVIAFVLAPQLMQLYTLRLHGAVGAEQRAVATTLLRWFVPQIVLYAAVALGTCILNARRRFALAAFAPAVANVVEIALFVAVHHVVGGAPTLHRAAVDRRLTTLLGAGTTTAVVAIAVPICIAVCRTGPRPRLRVDWSHPAVRRAPRLSGWSIGYVATNQALLWCTVAYADAYAGGVAAWTAALMFFQLPHDVVAISIMSTMSPELSRLALARNWDAYRLRFAGGLRLLWLVTFPAAAGYLVLGRPLLQALLQHGALTHAASEQTARLLVALAIGLPAFSCYLYTLRGFWALHDARTPFLLNALENAVNLVLLFVLPGRFGLAGIAGAFALGYVAVAPVALVALHRRAGVLRGQHLAGALAQTVAITAAMATLLVVLHHMLVGVDGLESSALSAAAGLAVFGLLALLTTVEEVREVRLRVVQQLRRAGARA